MMNDELLNDDLVENGWKIVREGLREEPTPSLPKSRDRLSGEGNTLDLALLILSAADNNQA